MIQLAKRISLNLAICWPLLFDSNTTLGFQSGANCDLLANVGAEEWLEIVDANATSEWFCRLEAPYSCNDFEAVLSTLQPRAKLVKGRSDDLCRLEFRAARR